MKRKLFYCLLPLCVLFFLGACAPATKIINTWDAPGARADPIQKVLVIAVTKKAGNRDLAENAFIEEFEKLGVQAVPSAAMLPKDTEITRERVKEAIKGADIDAVFVMELMDIKAEEVRVPPRFAPVHDGFMPHMVHAPIIMAEPGYIARQVVVQIKSTLYGTADGNPVWEAISETQDPMSAEKMLPGYRKAVMKALKEKGFLP